MAWNKKNTSSDKPSKNQIITDAIIQALNEDKIPWKRPWESYEVMSIDNKPYRGINKVLLSLTSYTDPRFLTFNRCKELGGSVRKGEKGHLIVLWNFNKVKTTDSNKEVSEKSVPFMRTWTVFNVEQCEGLTLKPLKEKKTIDFVPIDEAKNLISKYEITLNHEGNGAFYHPIKDEVTMPLPEFFHSAESYYSTLFHEFIHSTGHITRLNREMKGHFGSEKYSKEELIAEIGAAFMSAECHIDNQETEENTKAYIQSWIQALQKDPNLIIQAASQAQKAIDLIKGIKYNNDVNTDDTQEEEAAA
jgi:antirestriction protein ArdC